jgi:hypothetical protein
MPPGNPKALPLWQFAFTHNSKNILKTNNTIIYPLSLPLSSEHEVLTMHRTSALSFNERCSVIHSSRLDDKIRQEFGHSPILQRRQADTHRN